MPIREYAGIHCISKYHENGTILNKIGRSADIILQEPGSRILTKPIRTQTLSFSHFCSASVSSISSDLKKFTDSYTCVTFQSK